MDWKFWKKSSIPDKVEFAGNSGTKEKVSQEPDTIPQDNPRYMNTFITEEFSALKPENLSDYIIWATVGLPCFMYFLFEIIRQRDLRVGTALMRRKFAVLDEMFTVNCEWEEGKKFAEKVLEHISGKLFRFFTQCVESNLHGLKRFEINYEVFEGQIFIKDIKAVSNFLYLYDETNDTYHFIDIKQTDAMKILSHGVGNTYEKTDFDKIPKVNIDPDKVLDVFGLDGDNRNAFMNGISISFIIGYFFKNYNVKDMNIFIERFASPTIDAQYDGVNPTARNNMLKAIMYMKNNGFVIREKGSEVGLLNDNQKGQASQIFLNTIKYWDTSLTIRVLGEEETTKMGDQGSRAALQIKKYVSDDIMVADLKVITSAVNDLLKRLFDFNFAKPKEYAKIQFIKVKTLEDKKTQSEIIGNVTSAGYKPTKEYVEENLDIKVDESTDPEPVPPKKEEPPAKTKHSFQTVDEMITEYLGDVWNKTKKKEEEQ